MFVKGYVTHSCASIQHSFAHFLKDSIFALSMLSFISLNARGLKNNVKRKAIFLFCKEQKANCVFLQETHPAEADTKFWKVQWGDNIFFQPWNNTFGWSDDFI